MSCYYSALTQGRDGPQKFCKILRTSILLEDGKKCGEILVDHIASKMSFFSKTNLDKKEARCSCITDVMDVNRKVLAETQRCFRRESS